MFLTISRVPNIPMVMFFRNCWPRPRSLRNNRMSSASRREPCAPSAKWDFRTSTDFRKSSGKRRLTSWTFSKNPRTCGRRGELKRTWSRLLVKWEMRKKCMTGRKRKYLKTTLTVISIIQQQWMKGLRQSLVSHSRGRLSKTNPTSRGSQFSPWRNEAAIRTW